MKSFFLPFLLFVGITLSAQTTIVDANFEQALIDLGYDTVLDGSVTTANISGVTFLNVSNKQISDLTGIAAFTELGTLIASDNNIVNLDLSANTKLVNLSLANNSITSLDLNAQTSLVNFNASNNALTSLSLKNNNNFNINIFDITNNPNLTCVEVTEWLYAVQNWTNVDSGVDFNVNCPSAEPTTTVVDANFEQALIDLGYDTVLDGSVVTANIANVLELTLDQLSISDLTGIEDFTSLRVLRVKNNNLSSLDLSNNTDLRILSCSNNNLSSLDFSNNSDLKILSAYKNQLTSLNVANKSLLVDLNVSDNNLSSIDVSTNIALISFKCKTNNLTNIDVSNNVNLKVINCSVNSISSLDFTSNTDLRILSAYKNTFTTVDFSNNLLLKYVSCANNVNLTSLDFSANTALTTVLLANNPELSSLNLKNGNNTNVIKIRLQDNPKLSCVEVDDATYSTSNWTYVDAGLTFNVDCNAAAFTFTERDFVVFPNPAVDVLNISTRDNLPFTAYIFTLQGTLVTITQSSQIDVSFLPSGIYTIQLLSGGQYAHKTFVKQ